MKPHKVPDAGSYNNLFKIERPIWLNVAEWEEAELANIDEQEARVTLLINTFSVSAFTPG